MQGIELLGYFVGDRREINHVLNALGGWLLLWLFVANLLDLFAACYAGWLDGGVTENLSLSISSIQSLFHFLYMGIRVGFALLTTSHDGRRGKIKFDLCM